MRRLSWLILIVLILSACAPVPLAGPEKATPSPSTVPPGPGVADLLRDPPPPGETVEVDAYFSRRGAPVFPSPYPPPDQVRCPYKATLTDRPFPAVLHLLNGSQSNILPDDAPWLVATTPEATQPGVYIEPQLPYHARLRGRLGDPAFAHCPHADRILVVEDVVTVYVEQPPDPSAYRLKLPDDYAAWPRYHDAALGYSLPYPSNWTIEPLAEQDVLAAIALHAPQWPDYPVVMRVHVGETHHDQYDWTSRPPLLQGGGLGVFEQGWVFVEESAGSQHLAGYQVDREAGPGERAVSVLFSAHGRTYELALRYPTGFDASQPLLTAYSAIVEGFQLDVPPGPTPTPPVKQTLGPGPFLSQEEALAHVREGMGKQVELLDARLMSEADARRIGQPSLCSTFMGHPDGVWVLTVLGVFDGTAHTMRLLLDATTGEQLCGEEINPEATPYSTMPPGTTATPVPTETPSPTPSALSPESAPFARVRRWMADPTGLTSLREAFIADTADYLTAHLDPTRSLARQSAALKAMTHALSSFGGGQTVPVELDGEPPEELFVVPNLSGAPLLYARLVDGAWQVEAIPTWPIGQPDQSALDVPNVWPASAEALDTTGDGRPEAVVRHTFAGGSGWRELVQILRHRPDGWDVLFRAELVNWAGSSTWALEPDPAGGQMVHLTYPIFLPGRHPKVGINPQGEQFWRWDDEAGRYRLAWETVGPPAMGPAELGQAERAFAAGDYAAAISLYDAFLADEVWRRDFLKDYATGLPGVGQRELAAWLDLARLHRGLSLALTGHPEDARVALTGLETTDPLAELADAFLDAYSPAGDLLAGLAAYERRLAAGPGDKLSDELDRPAGVQVAFLPQPTLVLAALAQVGPERLATTLEAITAPIADLRLSDLNEDGSPEVVWLSPPAWHDRGPNNVPVGNWQQTWVAWWDGTRWRATGIAAADGIELLGVASPDSKGRRGIELRLTDVGETRQVTLFWDGEVSRPLPLAEPPGWPVVGWPDF